MTRNSLWKFFSIAAILALLVVACGGDDDDDDPTATSPSAGGAPTATRETDSGDGGGGGDDGDAELIAMGEQLYNEQGCVACHSTDGSAGVGPTWEGLLGRETTLDDGSTVTADADYIEESIRDPNAKVVEGFQPNLMPAFDNFSDDEIAAIVAFIGSLSD